MELLEKLWEGTGTFFNGLLTGVERSLTGIFGSSNARQVKRMQARVAEINALEPKMQSLTDQELRQQTDFFRMRLKKGETLDDILVEAFAVCREAGRRFLRMRHYDVQLIGGMVLHSGSIAEMVTGEGKTLVATLPAYLNALEGRGVHVVTVNDYLARRDMEWMGPLYMGLGLRVGNIQAGMENEAKQFAYSADITYGTNNEFGFDYLRDNMKLAARGDGRFPPFYQQVQGPLHFAIVDEVDNILIDEARTPLIISGPAHQDVRKYADANRIAMSLQRERDFIVNEKDHTVNLTDEGVRRAEKLAGVESFYTAGNMEWPHLIDNALKAHHLYKLDVNYVIKEGQIIIVDEFTGRLMEGRQWSDGLHQAVEAKEGVPIKEETQTLATITLQNFFKLYKKLAGMTGTAMTEANEFWKIYKLDVIAIPTNRGMKRIEHPDVIYLTEKEKFHALADEVERVHRYDTIYTRKGERRIGSILKENDEEITFRDNEDRQTVALPKSEIAEIERHSRPILIGTVSIEKSERLSELLERRGIRHQVLNAKQHRREAEIIAQAGRLNAITIATNMAGRGTDIILGGNAETMAWAQLQDQYPTRLEVPREVWDTLVSEIETSQKMKEEGEKVREFGGLYVIGTERHESRRIDLQLRGRCGRQGDPGSSRFYLSLEDDLMRIFAGDFVRSTMQRMGMKEGDSIESSFISRRISAAQKKVEERNFEIRKNLLEYDEVMDTQRKRVYSYRQLILEGTSCRQLVLDQIREQVDKYVEQFLDPMFGPESFAKWAGPRLACQLDAKDFKGIDRSSAENYAKDLAERAAETQIVDVIDECLPAEEEESEWNWEALIKWLQSRYQINLRMSELKKFGRDQLDTALLEMARERIAGVDLAEGLAYLDENYGGRMLADWMKSKFSVDVSPQSFVDQEFNDVSKELFKQAEQAYEVRAREVPILAALDRFKTQVGPTTYQIQADALRQWAVQRFDNPELANLGASSQADVLATLSSASQRSLDRSYAATAELEMHLTALFGDEMENVKLRDAHKSESKVDAMIAWLKNELHWEVDRDAILLLDAKEIRLKATQYLEQRFCPEIRRMERQVLLSIVDAAWKDHLLAMDHLKSAIGLKGYAQMDPKVEYKREGMKLFQQMWLNIGERVTDVILRMEGFSQLDLRSAFVETQARHDSVQPQSEFMKQQQKDIQAANDAGNEKKKMEPIRRTGDRIGRNDPCPCGSGKKYKNCCMRRQI